MSKDVRLPQTEYTPHCNNLYLRDQLTVSQMMHAVSDRKTLEENMTEHFVLHDGPPYANGHTHLGHALNKVMKDALSRAHFLLGHASLVRPGWDCHGLPTEWAVQEKMVAEGRWPVGVTEFKQECAQFAGEWQKVQSKEMQSLGVMMDWHNPYLSMSPEAESATVSVFHSMVKRGLVYKSMRPALWSVPEQTALADAEVEYKDSRYCSLLVKFPFTGNDLCSGSNLVVWTSTPWSLPGNRMVALNADFNYLRVLVDDDPEKDYVLAEGCLESFLKEVDAKTHKVLGCVSGDCLLNSEVRVFHPLYGNEVKLYHGDFVLEAGTGVVHVAPSLGPDDFKLAKLHGVEVDRTLEGDGTYHKDVPLFGGQTVMNSEGKWGEAQGNVLALLSEKNMLVAQSYKKHSAPHSWRSGSQLLYRATTQYFVSMSYVKEEALSWLEDVEFNTDAYKNRMTSMLSGRPDWCVSRQRKWGVPMGVFAHTQTGELLTDIDVLDRTAKLFREHGGNCWEELPASNFLGDKYNPDDYQKVLDTLDVWFESGATWSWVTGFKHADLYLEGSDQTRGWFQSSLLSSVAVQNTAPYDAVMVHGFVLAEDKKTKKGVKMSKSKGNGVSPQKVMETYGVDALRWFFLSCDTANDVVYSEESMKGARKTVVKFGNTLKWLLGVMDDVQYDTHSLMKRDKLFLSALAHQKIQMDNLFAANDLLGAANSLHKFCLMVSNVMVTTLRDTLYCNDRNDPDYVSAQFFLRCLFESLCSWFSVFVPCTAEQAWKHYQKSLNSFFSSAPMVSLNHTLPKYESMLTVERLEKFEFLVSEREKLLSLVDTFSSSSAPLGSLVLETSHELDYDLLRDMCGCAEVRLVKPNVHLSHYERCDRCRNWKPDVTEVDGEKLCRRCEVV